MQTETVILAHLMKRDCCGYEINKSIQEHSEGQYELKEAALYSAFRRLKDAGIIQSYWGDETTDARRRYFHITAEGRKDFYRRCKEWQEAKKLIDLLLTVK